MEDSLVVASNRIGAAASPKVGFPTALIAQIAKVAIPMLIDCFLPADAQQAKTYVGNNYGKGTGEEKYGGYESRLVKRTMLTVRRAARQERQRVDDDQAREIAIRMLDDLRTAPAQEVDGIVSGHYAN